MKINDRILDRMFGMIYKQYPFIIDMEYTYEEDKYDPFTPHRFKFYIDLDKVGELFPDATLDTKFIRDYMFHVGAVNASEVFNEFIEDEDVYMFGEGVNDFINAIIGSVIRHDLSFTCRFFVG
jgi:hypothetical protein